MKSPEQRGHYGALFVPNHHRSLQNTHEEPFGDICPTHLRAVDDCAKSEIAYCPYGPVRGPSTTFQPRTGPYGQYAISDLSQSAFKMHTQVAAGALIFIFYLPSVLKTVSLAL